MTINNPGLLNDLSFFRRFRASHPLPDDHPLAPDNFDSGEASMELASPLPATILLCRGARLGVPMVGTTESVRLPLSPGQPADPATLTQRHLLFATLCCVCGDMLQRGAVPQPLIETTSCAAVGCALIYDHLLDSDREKFPAGALSKNSHLRINWLVKILGTGNYLCLLRSGLQRRLSHPAARKKDVAALSS
eukprot:gnl/Dysnectes_brevis/2150_a2502_1012.p2 GENE.gnl/Dysnectes_brevis/2150_a2502_1012~~gnl/Dysnectes_brevis/2150_a2502_1012.p2  ORF type:complete len:192 (+),score=44.03 gnl/Dysnectes_brevis/2150_a2502_1012:1128-1703(+)